MRKKTTAKRYDEVACKEKTLEEEHLAQELQFEGAVHQRRLSTHSSEFATDDASSSSVGLHNDFANVLEPEVFEIDDEAPDILYKNGKPQLEDGTVVVQPVEAPASITNASNTSVSANQARGASASEVTSATAAGQATSSPPKRRTFAFGPLDKVKCTSCATRIDPFHSDENELQVHPVLRTLICYKCFEYYGDGKLDVDDDGKENQCRWCSEGGTLICCDKCPNSFCKSCIRRNLGRSELHRVENMEDDEVWQCYVCDQKPLVKLLEETHETLVAIEEHNKNKRKREMSRQRTQGKRRLDQQNAVSTESSATAAPINITNLTAGVMQTSFGRQVIQNSLNSNLLQHQPPPPAANTATTLPNSKKVFQQQQQRRSAPAPLSAPPIAQFGNNANRMAPPQQQIHRTAATLHQQNALPMRPAQNFVSAQTGVMTEQWYKKNIHVADMLQEIESVSVNNIEVVLKALLTALTTMTRQYTKIYSEFRQAPNSVSSNSQLVQKVKTSLRLHLFLRLGKLRTLILEEEKRNSLTLGMRSDLNLPQFGNSSVGGGTHTIGLGMSNSSLLRNPVPSRFIDLTAAGRSDSQHVTSSSTVGRKVTHKPVVAQPASKVPPVTHGEEIVLLSDDEVEGDREKEKREDGNEENKYSRKRRNSKSKSDDAKDRRRKSCASEPPSECAASKSPSECAASESPSECAASESPSQCPAFENVDEKVMGASFDTSNVSEITGALFNTITFQPEPQIEHTHEMVHGVGASVFEGGFMTADNEIDPLWEEMAAAAAASELDINQRDSDVLSALMNTVDRSDEGDIDLSKNDIFCAQTVCADILHCFPDIQKDDTDSSLNSSSLEPCLKKGRFDDNQHASAT